ncbi:MAG: hypothetical protein ACD_39C00636G0001, partial [uncultured bacterium]
EKIVIWGNGAPLREYSYSIDLARIYLWALENYDDAQVLNIGSTEENSVRDIAYMTADIMGISRERLFFDETKPLGIMRKNTDNSRFIKLSGFKYTPFREGLEKTIKWFSHAYEHQRDKLRLGKKSNTIPLTGDKREI